jgi:hypothetical protein
MGAGNCGSGGGGIGLDKISPVQFHSFPSFSSVQ